MLCDSAADTFQPGAMVRRRVLVISRHQTRLLRGTPAALIVFAVLPLLVMVIMRSTQKSALIASGYTT